MLFDVLSGLDKVKICTHYELDGVKIDTPVDNLQTLTLQSCLRGARRMEGRHHRRKIV